MMHGQKNIKLYDFMLLRRC